MEWLPASTVHTVSTNWDKLSVRSSEHSDQRELGRKTAKLGINARSWALSILHTYFMYSTNKHRRRKKEKMKDRNPYVNNISLPWHLRLRLKAQCNTLLYSKNQTCNGQEKRNKQKRTVRRDLLTPSLPQSTWTSHPTQLQQQTANNNNNSNLFTTTNYTNQLLILNTTKLEVKTTSF